MVLARIVRLRELFISFITKFKRGFTDVVVTRAGCFDTSYESGLKESFSCTHTRYTCLRFVPASLSTTYWVGNSYTGTLNINETGTIAFLIYVIVSLILRVLVLIHNAET